LAIEYSEGKILPHYSYNDFVVNKDIIIEVKAIKEVSNEHIAPI
jgi:hypothetical protein